jgi:small GTP-binding protein
MGFIFSKILEFFSRSRNKFKIILLGIQNAGKTTILYRLSIGQLVKTTPTIGSNVEEISYNNVKLQAWDLGGQESTRSIWDVYFINTDAIIYVIDTHDETYDDSKTQFYKLLKNEALKNAIVLIYANKQDLPGAKSVGEIIQIYEFDTIKDHIWHIQPCSALTGEGLITGMKWLSDQLVFKSNNNFPVNPYVDFPEDKNEGKKIKNSNNKNNKNNNKNNMGQSLNNSEANLGNASYNQNSVGNINNTTNEDNNK